MKRCDWLLEMLSRPEKVLDLQESGWDLLVHRFRQTRLLARLAALMQQQKLLDLVPTRPRTHLLAALTSATKCHRAVRWEVRCLRRVLTEIETPIVLLKGAAYVLSQLPPARGRLFADVDILVPERNLAGVERTLLQSGWEPLKLDPYDQRYYRAWMHELPPMRHHERKMEVDIHHSILPRTGRLHPDPQKLLAAARPLEDPKFLVLAPTDMILHSIVHLFQDGDSKGGLRDLIDLDDLFRHFDAEPGFWDRFVPRTRELGLTRPLYYATRALRRILQTPFPAAFLDEVNLGRSSWSISVTMDTLVTRALSLDPPEGAGVITSSSRWLLYVRSHWLKMPPLLLVQHLFRKALWRICSGQERKE